MSLPSKSALFLSPTVPRRQRRWTGSPRRWRLPCLKGDQIPVAWHFHTIEPYLEVRLSGKLHGEEFEHLEPQFEQLLREEGPLRVLCVLHDFHGWTAGGVWEEIKFDVRHFDDVYRLAIVGEMRWHASLAHVCRWLTTAEVRYFDLDELDDARDWLLQVSAAAVQRMEI